MEQGGAAGGGAAGARTRVSVRAAEALIQSLQGVEAARIVVDDWGAVREIHVLADASRHPKAIVRDIESALQAQWGLVVDRRRISVAQLAGSPRPPKWIRLRLQQLAVTSDPVRGRTEVAVSLAPELPRDSFGRPIHDPEIPDTIWQGRAAGSSGAGLSIRLAAEATLQALNQSLMPQHSFALADVARVPIGEREAILCLLHYHAPRGLSDLVTGSALIRGEPLEATVRAVLNGTNRLFGVAMRRQYGAGPVPQEPFEEDEEGAVHPSGAEVAAGAEGAQRHPSREADEGPRTEGVAPPGGEPT
jgi:hypothetical protein